MSEYTDALDRIGGLSNPSKMPTASWSIPARYCGTGSKLAAVEGTTCHGCYAMKGCYQFKSTRDAMERRYGILRDALAGPDAAGEFVSAFVTVLRERERRTRRTIERTGRVPKSDGRYFRWHDSGDVQSVEHLDLIVVIARAVPGVQFWLPTREAGYVRAYLAGGGTFPANLLVRLSTPRVDKPAAPVYLTLAKATGVELSGVHTGEPIVGDSCVAYRQDGECRDCRACWQDGERVSYPLH